MKQLIVTSKVVSDFIEQPNAIIYKTYCPRCTFYDHQEDDEISPSGHFCRIPDIYPSLCENGTIGFYRYNIKESIRLTNEAREDFHY